jgi:hypothetical protein
MTTIPVTIRLERSDSGIEATAVMELEKKTIESAAHAPSRRANDDVGSSLAIARVLRGLEVEVMHWVHEHIDRYVADE